MIDTIHNHSREKKSFANELNNFEIENITLSTRNSELQLEIFKIKDENKILSDKLKMILGKVVATKSFRRLQEMMKRLI